MIRLMARRRDDRPLGRLSLQGDAATEAERVTGILARLGLPRLLRLGVAAAIPPLWFEIALLHFRGSYQSKFMWLPVTILPVEMLAGLADTPATRRLFCALSWGTAALGTFGFLLHMRGVRRQVGGFYDWRYNFMTGPPVIAPPQVALFGVIGVLGTNQESSRTLSHKLRLVDAVGQLLLAIEAGYFHYRNYYANPVQYTPVSLAPLLALAQAAAVIIECIGPFPIQFAKIASSGTRMWGERLRTLMMDYNHYAGWGLNGECLPYPTNTVTVVPGETDQYGLPITKVTFSWGENEQKMMRGGVAQMRAILEAAGGEDIFEADDTAHLMGACRMGSDPTNSVVDQWCRSWDIRNLFICDGSVFVTSSGVNPSLTIEAIAARTAGYITAAARRREL